MKIENVLLSMGIIMLSAFPAFADSLRIEEDKASSDPTIVSVVNGQASSIMFENDQIINFVLLPDQSRTVFTPNAPIDSGKTTALYLRKIEEIDVPGATKSNSPNLVIETLDQQGKTQQYEFIIDATGSATDRDKIIIESAPPPPEPPPEPEPKILTTVETTYGSATPEDVALGLERAIDEGSISADGTVAAATREYIALVRNGNSANDAIAQTDIPLSVVAELGRLGQEEDAKRRIMPLPELPLGSRVK